MTFSVAIAGATSAVGREMLNVLHERGFPVGDLYALAAGKAVGGEVGFGDATLKLQPLEKFDFRGVDVVLSSPGAKVALDYAARATNAGAVIIDTTAAFRLDPDVPLVVPEVNAQAIAGYKKKNIIASPSASALKLAITLKPLHDVAGVKRVVVSTYQSVSGAGKEAMDELFNQTRTIYMNDTPEPKHLPRRIAFNVIPQIEDFMDDRASKEEWKIAAETKKILDPRVKLAVNCVRVPVFIGHSAMVNVEFDREMAAVKARQIWMKTRGVTLIDLETDMEYVTPVDAQGEDSVFISRSRDDITVENGISFWTCVDNLRKGAALNAVQIAEILAKEYL